MWNKNINRIIELEDKIGWLEKNYNDAKRTIEKIRLKELQEPKKNVYVYLKNKNTIVFYDADDFGFRTDDDMIKIIKNDEIIGLIKLDDVITICNNPMSIDENQHFYTIGGDRIW